jgi:hypothetical protein
MVIWKFQLDRVDSQQISMPKEAQVLSVAMQHGNICIWATVSPDAPNEDRVFEIRGTGNPLPADFYEDRIFIGTVFDGPYVWHVFERLLD